MKIRTKYQMITTALIASVVLSIAGMVIYTQREVMREQALQRLDVLMEGAARIAKESFDSRDRLMAVSYLLFLKNTYPELKFASLSYGGHQSKIGAEAKELLYIEKSVLALPESAQDTPNASATGVMVRFGFDRELVNEQINRALPAFIRWTALIAGGFLLLGLIANALLIRLVTGPIEALAMANAQLAAGQMNISLPVRANDEIGAVTRSFNVMAGRIRELLESREDILHTLTHEINTPLGGLKGYLELWQDKKIPLDEKKEEEILGTMMTAVLRMETSLGNALSLFKNDDEMCSGAADENVQINKVVEHAIIVFMPLARAGAITVIPLSKNVKVTMRVSEKLILQIVSNLLSNAIKYTPSGGEVRVGLAETADEVIFNVRNTGRGIPTEDIPHLFTKFYRGSQNNEKGKRIPGTGLGLYIVQKAVATLGGCVWVESKINEYSLFIVRLPKNAKKQVELQERL